MCRRATRRLPRSVTAQWCHTGPLLRAAAWEGHASMAARMRATDSASGVTEVSMTTSARTGGS